MAFIQSLSDEVESALRDPGRAWLATRILTRVEAMGLLGPVGPRPIGPPALAEALEALVSAGVARREAQAVLAGRSGESLWPAIDDAIAESAVPDSEWVSMGAVLGDELLARLVGASATSIGRYRRGDRRTPDEVASRLHFLALVVADLAGSYNDRGVRRWFDRPRPQLDGQAPAALLHAAWDPDDPGPRRVAALASALVGAGGAT